MCRDAKFCVSTKVIGNAYDLIRIVLGQQLEVEIRGKAYPAVVVKRPFYRSQNRLI
jgi:glycine cleavage system aminomethyltransferase T